MMPTYTVRDSQTKKTITFEWKGNKPPTQADMQEVFATARQGTIDLSGGQADQQANAQRAKGYLEGGGSGGPLEMLLGMGPETAGGIAGGVKAAKKGTGAGMLFSGAGGAIGEGVQQIVQKLMGSDNAPQNIQDALTRIGAAAGTEAAGEGAGRFLFGAISKILKPTAAVEPGTARIDSVLSKYMPDGAPFLTPGQAAAEGSATRRVEAFARQGIGSGSLAEHGINQRKAIDKYSDDVINGITNNMLKNASPEELGLLYQDNKKTVESIFKKASAQRYKKIDSVIKGELAAQGSAQTTYKYDKDLNLLSKKSKAKPLPADIVSFSGIKKFALEMKKLAEKRQGIGSTDAGEGLLGKVLKLGDTATFKDAHDLRSAMFDEYDRLKLTADKGRGLANHMIKLLDKEMEVASKKLSPKAYLTWKEADTFYKEGKNQLSNKLMKSLDNIASTRPEAVIDTIFRDKGVTLIKNVKEVVKPETWDKLRGKWLEQAMNESINGGDFLLGVKFDHKIKAMGRPALKEMFTPMEIKQIKNIVDAAKMSQRNAGPGGGVVQFLQTPGGVGAAAGAYTGNLSLMVGGAAIMVSPYALSRLMLNPKTNYWLKQGFKAPAKSKQGGIIASKILAEIGRYNAEEVERSDNE